MFPAVLRISPCCPMAADAPYWEYNTRRGEGKTSKENQMNLRSAKNILKMSLVTATVIGGALAAQATITSGLAGEWKFSDGYGITAPDSSGLSNTGMLSGAAYFVTDPVRGQVLNVNGVSGEMDVPYN